MADERNKDLSRNRYSQGSGTPGAGRGPKNRSQSNVGPASAGKSRFTPFVRPGGRRGGTSSSADEGGSEGDFGPSRRTARGPQWVPPLSEEEAARHPRLAEDISALRDQEIGRQAAHVPQTGDLRDDATSREFQDSADSMPKSDLRDAEGQSYYNNSPSSNSQSGSAQGRSANLNRFKKFAKKRKARLILGGIGASGLIGIFLFLMFVLGVLELPHFMSNVIGWQFAKISQMADKSLGNVIREQMAIRSADAATKASMDKQYGSDAVYKEEASLDTNKVGELLQTEGNWKENINSSGHLESVTLSDGEGGVVTSSVSPGQMNNGVIDQAQLTGNVSSLEANALAAFGDNNNPAAADQATYTDPVTTDYIEGSVDAGDLATDTAGITEPNKFSGESETDALATLEKDYTFPQATEGVVPATESSDPSSISDTTSTAEAALEKDVQSSTGIKGIVSNFGSLPDDVTNTISSSFVTSALKSAVTKLLSFISPLASNAMYAYCIIYTGTKPSQQTATTQSTELQRQTVFAMAVANQQERGSPYITPEAAGAMAQKLQGNTAQGDLETSIPLERASGAKVSTSNISPAEGSAFGSTANTNVLNALGFPSTLVGPLTLVSNTVCPVLTNIWVNATIGIASLVALFASGGTSSAADTVGDATVQEVTDSLMTRFINNITDTYSTKAGWMATGKLFTKFGVKTVINGGSVAALTFLGKLLIYARMGAAYNGLPMGLPYANSLDNGANMLSSSLVGREYGGRPLTNAEAAQQDAETHKLLVSFNQARSPYQRYFALSNPMSLASVLGDKMAVSLGHGAFASLLDTAASDLFNPLRLVGQMFGSLSGRASAAATNTANFTLDQDYGNVQQGYSDSELGLIDSNPSYLSPSANDKALNADSSKASAVAQTYGPCFTHQMANLLTTDDGSGVPEVVRYANGDISTTQGLCSAQNLGPQNPQYGDLVFRYRLSLMYNTQLDILQGIANAQ